MDIEKMLLKGNLNAFKEHDRTQPVPGLETPGEEPTPSSPATNPFKERTTLSDFKSALPINESEWKSSWGDKRVKIKPINEKKGA